MVQFRIAWWRQYPWPLWVFTFLSFKVPAIIVPKNFIVFFVVLLCGLFIALFMSNNIIHENTFRSLYNYLGVVVFYLGSLIIS